MTNLLNLNVVFFKYGLVENLILEKNQPKNFGIGTVTLGTHVSYKSNINQ